jgi:hypothetical protein
VVCERPPSRLGDPQAHDLDRLVGAIEVWGHESSSNQSIKRLKREAAREHDGSDAAIWVLGEEGEGAPALFVEGSIELPSGHEQSQEALSSGGRTSRATWPLLRPAISRRAKQG